MTDTRIGAGFTRGVALVAAAQAYFLIHAEFGLIDLLTQAGLEGSLRVFMGLLAAGGLAGCAWTALGRPDRSTLRLRAACALSALGALAACSSASGAVLGASALVSGLGLGLWTATLAGSLTNYFSSGRLGLGAGLGVGLAYALCNLPPLFHGGGHLHAVAGAALALLGLFCVSSGSIPATPASAQSFRSFAPWLVLFLALIWFDSAIFYLFNHLPAPAPLPDLAPRSNPWAGNLWLTGGTHLAAALVAGFLWDRGRGRGLLALAFAGLLLGALSRSLDLIPGRLLNVADTMAYASAVSVYSTLLVAFPASGRASGLSPFVQASLLYAVAGWIGSALGIGLAQDLGRVPAYVTALLILAMIWAAWGRRRGLAVLAVGSASLAATRFPAGEAASPTSDFAGKLVAEGRELFRNEGCFHCHSQFSRPVAADLERWGPAPNLDEWLQQRPPLPGNRRQGPDLSLVGSRRGPRWIASHLRGEVAPGSRMPRYRDFSPAKTSALLAYLTSLGREHTSERMALAASWRPERGTLPSTASGKLFSTHCASCHGASGRGDGPMAKSLPRQPRNLVSDRWLFVSAGSETEEILALSRVIKFGVPGTEMPGHEWLSDSDITALALHVLELRPPSQSQSTNPQTP